MRLKWHLAGDRRQELTVEALDTGPAEDDDKGRGSCRAKRSSVRPVMRARNEGRTSAGDVGVGTEETAVVVGDEQADDCERREVDDCDTPGRCRSVISQHSSCRASDGASATDQKVPLTAEGIDSLGLGVSEAARPTSSVPANEKAAVTKTEHTPLKPLASLVVGDEVSVDTIRRERPRN